MRHFFDSRSKTNRSLLEIQDAFRLEKKTQQELIQQQKLERLEHQEDVWFLQRVILLVSIFFYPHHQLSVFQLHKG